MRTAGLWFSLRAQVLRVKIVMTAVNIEFLYGMPVQTQISAIQITVHLPILGITTEDISNEAAITERILIVESGQYLVSYLLMIH